MKQRLHVGAVLGAILIIVTASCKKSSDDPVTTNATRIIGSWRQAYEAADSNNNSRPDSSERVITRGYRVLSFYRDGNVHDTSFVDDTASSRDATYAVNGDYLTLYFRGVRPSRITQLDAGILMLQDTTDRPARITVFNKLP